MRMKRIIIAVSVAAVAIIAAMAIFSPSGPPSGRTENKPPEPRIDTSRPGRVIPIDVTVLQRLMAVDPNLVIIDVREAEERSGPLGFIPNSLNLPVRTSITNPDSLPRGKTLVFICRSGPRSLEAARNAAALGLTSYYVQGGMKAWRQMLRLQDKENRPASPDPAAPRQVPEETPFFGRDMGC